MLHFILGPSGSGKSYQMLAELRTRAERGERSILIVPEQFTSSTEGVLYRTLGDSLSAYVESYSFTSLSEALLRRYGGAPGHRRPARPGPGIDPAEALAGVFRPGDRRTAGDEAGGGVTGPPEGQGEAAGAAERGGNRGMKDALDELLDRYAPDAGAMWLAAETPDIVPEHNFTQICN